MPAILLNPPAIEPLTLAEARQFLRVEHDDDDDTIVALIAAARRQVEAQTRRALIAQSWRLTRDVWPRSGALPILPVPLREVLAIGVYDAAGLLQMLDVEAFDIDKVSAPALLAFARAAPPAPGRSRGGIEIDIAAGYGEAADDVPQPLRQAMRLLVAHWYENRRIVAASGEIASLPASVAALIAPFRVLSL